MDLALEEKVVVVTGASSGIGRATSACLVREGARVVLVGRDVPALQALRYALGDDRARVAAADVTEPDAAARVVGAALAAFERIDGLVNAAGMLQGGAIDVVTDASWDAQLALNLTAPMRMMRACTPALVATRGAVVNVSSVAGARAFPGLAAYCVSKAGLDELTRCAALDLAPRGVRVNAVNPGVIVTDLHRRGGMSDEAYALFLERSKTTHPLGRVGSADEVADAIVFLLSPCSGFITGATLPVDGGRGETCAR